MKRALTVFQFILTVICFFGIDTMAQQPGSTPNSNGEMDKSDDLVLQHLIEENVPKFVQFTYNDEQTGKKSGI